MAKNIQNPVKKETAHKFHVEYTTHTMQKKHMTNRDKVIEMFELALKPVTVQSTKNKLTKRKVSVISLMMFY